MDAAAGSDGAIELGAAADGASVGVDEFSLVLNLSEVGAVPVESPGALNTLVASPDVV